MSDEAMDTEVNESPSNTVFFESMSVVTEWTGGNIPHVDDSNTAWSEKRPMDRFIGILDQLDARVERLRKEALQLQEKRDLLLLSMDLLKNNELLSTLSENEREEIECYAKRVASRLHTVELNVRTVRDSAQEDHLHQINVFIDGLISHPDPLSSRQKCQQFLYSCGFFDVTPAKEDDNADKGGSTSTDIPDILPIDKKFESALLGCTLDDQKIVRKRLQALLNYLIKQSISD